MNKQPLEHVYSLEVASECNVKTLAEIVRDIQLGLRSCKSSKPNGQTHNSNCTHRGGDE